jgi:hypothetical protein
MEQEPAGNGLGVFSSASGFYGLAICGGRPGLASVSGATTRVMAHRTLGAVTAHGHHHLKSLGLAKVKQARITS